MCIQCLLKLFDWEENIEKLLASDQSQDAFWPPVNQTSALPDLKIKSPKLLVNTSIHYVNFYIASLAILNHLILLNNYKH